MGTQGQWLFRRSDKLTDYLDQLGGVVHDEIGLLLDEGWTAPDMLERLQQRYRLWSLNVQVLLWTQVSTVTEKYSGDGGEERLRSPVQGYVPYQGSRLLWDVCPAPGFRFPLRGKVGKHGVKLCAYVDGKDVAPFEALVEAELQPLREALHAFQPTVRGYNDQIRQTIDLQMRTY